MNESDIEVVIAAARAVVETVDEEVANGGHVIFFIADKVLDLSIALADMDSREERS